MRARGKGGSCNETPKPQPLSMRWKPPGLGGTQPFAKLSPSYLVRTEAAIFLGLSFCPPTRDDTNSQMDCDHKGH